MRGSPDQPRVCRIAPTSLASAHGSRTVRPERPGGQPTRRCATAVAATVADPCATALMAELAVELDEHALVAVPDVVPCGRGRRRGHLPLTAREPVRPLDIADVADLHRALGAAGDVAQHLPEQVTPGVPRTIGQVRQEDGLGCPLPLEGPAEQREQLVDLDRLCEVQDRVLRTRDPRPPQLVDLGVEVASTPHRCTARWADCEVAGYQQLKLAGRRVDQAPDEGCGVMRPGRIGTAGQVCRRRRRPPVIPTGRGQVDAVLDAAPSAVGQPDLHGLPGQTGVQALGARHQSALLRGEAVSSAGNRAGTGGPSRRNHSTSAIGPAWRTPVGTRNAHPQVRRR